MELYNLVKVNRLNFKSLMVVFLLTFLISYALVSVLLLSVYKDSIIIKNRRPILVVFEIGFTTLSGILGVLDGTLSKDIPCFLLYLVYAPVACITLLLMVCRKIGRAHV